MDNTKFKAGTKNDAIFRTNAPYNNPYQGPSARWLFVCSAGLLRSPTGASLAARHGINARSCGSNMNYALVPCSSNLIKWADKIICVNQENLAELNYNFADYPELLKEIQDKQIVLDIPDNFDYMNPHLVQAFDAQLFQPYGPVTTK